MAKQDKVTRALVVSAALAALGVIALTLGSLIQVLDLTMAVIASLFVVLAVIELGGKYPWLVYAVTAILSILLIPTKTAALTYLCFAGYYPIIKAKLEGVHLHRVLCLVIKLLIFNGALAVITLVTVKVMMIPIPDPRYYWILSLLSVVFVLYDLALTRLITAYLCRWRSRLTFLHK